MQLSFSLSIAAQKTGLSARTLHNAVKDSRLRAIRVGRRVLITDEALQAFLQNPTGEGVNHVAN